MGLLWTAEVILHLGFCAASAAVTQWYFASIEAPLSPRYGSAVGLATWRAIRYAPGSLALGALLVIPGRIFRFFLEHCLHQAQTDGRGKPELRGVANCCLLCCLDCSTKYVQYISHNAYIYVAVHDFSFCEGAKQAFELTLRNIGQARAPLLRPRTCAPPFSSLPSAHLSPVLVPVLVLPRPQPSLAYARTSPS